MDTILIAFFVFIASGIGTLTGFGSSTILVPILLFYFPLPETLLFAGIIHWFGDIWKMLLFRTGFRWKLIFSFGIPGLIATYIGANMVFVVSEEILSRILGVFLITYVFFVLFKSTFKIASSTFFASLGGGISGFLAGIFGMGGAVRSAFLSAFDLEKSVYIVTTGAIAFAIDSTRLMAYIQNDVRLSIQLLWGLLLFIPISFLGARMAKKLLEKIPQQRFRIVIACFLFLAGLRLLFLSA